jgi:GH25 family lysozyme M1 (1,4-beta-N-acetylmuramidase)
MSEKIDFAAKSKTFAGTPLAELLLNAQFEPLASVKNPPKESAVEAIQKALVGLGYNVGKGGVDGRFGNDTATAVKQFQNDVVKKIDPKPLGVVAPATDGRVDWLTLLALDAACAFVETQSPAALGQTQPTEPESPTDMLFGIDFYQPDNDGRVPDWEKAKKEGPLSFAIIQSNQGTMEWPTFKRDWQASAVAGITRGAYLFLSFPFDGWRKKEGKVVQIQQRPAAPDVQAEAFVKTVGDLVERGMAVDFPPSVDVEFPGSKRPHGEKDSKGNDDDPRPGRFFTGMSAKECLEWVRKAWDVLHDHYGVAPIIYTSWRVWHEDLEEIAAFSGLIESPLWLAAYVWKKGQPAKRDPKWNVSWHAPPYFVGEHGDPNVPTPWGDKTNWWIHQHQGDASGFPGFNQVDMNRFRSMVKGARGDRVKWVQRRLGIDENGNYDDAMFDAVVDHQKSFGIDPANGVIGPRTFATLCWRRPDGAGGEAG